MLASVARSERSSGTIGARGSRIAAKQIRPSDVKTKARR